VSVLFKNMLKTVKYGSAALHETCWWSSGPRGSLSSSITTQATVEVNKAQLEPRTEVNVFLMSGTVLLYVLKLLNMLVNMVQLQPHDIIQRSWRNR